jgi:4-hydroxy-3-polyprenylbenzoate decarboxylase
VKDLREWIALLEREGELVRVSAEVDPDLEITEIVDRTVKAGGPALLFEKPKGSEHPLLINQFGTERRMCLAFGVDKLDDIAQTIAELLEMQPPDGLREKVRGLRKLKSVADARSKTVGKGACQEIVLLGDEVDLGLLPIQRCWPGDPAPFITLPAVITHDPQTGGRNVGMYRMQVIDRNTTLCTGRSTRTAAPTISRPTAASRSPSRSGSTRSRPTRRARRCRSTSTSSWSPASCAATPSSS